ncbi:twin-arginine translocation pathway signal [Calothrix sp. NIES-2100]|nr:twin-arginine translocation pathway signal [Calothrix sp. NIES-2100]
MSNANSTATTGTNGFAQAVQPISNQVIATDNQGLVAGFVNIPVKDGEIPAYRAQPDTGENFPIVLVIQEIFGVHEHIQDIARRFAKLGYLAMSTTSRFAPTLPNYSSVRVMCQN